MKIEILDEAAADLIEGYHFYEAQADGLGSYFLDLSFLISTLFSFMPVCMQLFSDIDAVCRNGFLSLCITLLMEN